MQRIFFGPYGVRAGWRIAMWCGGVFFLLTLLGAGVMAAGVRPSFGAQVAVELAAAVLAGWGMLRLVDRRPIGALGFAADPEAARDAGIGFALGAAAIGLAGGVLAVAGTARWVADGGSTTEYVAALAQGLVFFAVAAAAEEALFRGYAFQALVQGIGAWPALLLSSALFALGHARNPAVDAVALANIFLAGVMLGAAYLRTRSLWFCTALHLGWNWTMSALLDFPVSGLTRDTPLYNEVSIGPRWLTGGDFGPEAGIAATVVILALAALILLWPGLRESARMRALRPLVDDRLGTGSLVEVPA
ncbi:CPBP family intramembrane glutamic endopeptidase [Longimicrobium sp.]|uniref:CPBP family intramembrane glutamic endopeptidase n=1 Tax=Longimicrobium sp. TaxID=2029185 RepID=UPI002BD4BA73|nr:CPBP family intramembrane glutamic endopeptidase [Longimicrobium sp.]HSU13941.1 CPBP family intramembrane glutamic endopeptidase [Longimicrobium sp.]